MTTDRRAGTKGKEITRVVDRTRQEQEDADVNNRESP